MGSTLQRLIDIFGRENVTEAPEFSSSSVGPGSPGTPGLPAAPDYLVAPENTDQVQELVKLANERSLPLIPVSSSPPHRSGGVLPTTGGAVIVDLRRMNRILHVDRRSRLVLIEPGVTWDELSTELARHGLRIAPPLLPKRGKSVIATLLDREPLLSPKFQWNMNEPLRSLEIIWGTGDKIYSGMGGHRGETEEAWVNGTIPVTNAGPHQFDFMKMLTASQGTFGIVTWASVKVELAATAETALFFEGNSVDELTGFLYRVLQYRFGDEILIFNAKALSAILAGAGSGAGSNTGGAAEAAVGGANLAPWTAFVNVTWGALRAAEKIASQEADIRDIARANGILPADSVAGHPVAEVARKILSLAGETDWKTSGPEIFFLSTLDRIPEQLKTAADVAERYAYPFADCPVYLQPLHQGVAVHCHIVLPGVTNELYDQMSRELADGGAFFSRPYGIWSDIVYSHNEQHTNLTRKMKDIFDPANIMNPGKLCFQGRK